MKWPCWIIGHWNVYEPWRQGSRGCVRANTCSCCGRVDHWQFTRTNFKPLDVS
jgi:hypothetical protein